jgi:hypothetical protein
MLALRESYARQIGRGSNLRQVGRARSEQCKPGDMTTKYPLNRLSHARNDLEMFEINLRLLFCMFDQLARLISR